MSNTFPFRRFYRLISEEGRCLEDLGVDGRISKVILTIWDGNVYFGFISLGVVTGDQLPNEGFAV